MAGPRAWTTIQNQTVVSFFARGEWYYFEVDFHSGSVLGLPGKPVTAFVLGWDGRVHIGRGEHAWDERIPDAGLGRGKLGYMLKIRNIGGEVYACGASGQVYLRQGQNWVHRDEGVLDRRGPMQGPLLNGMDGTGEDDIYAVGKRGAIYHFAGASWKRLDSPVRVDLYGVRCVSRDEVYICGAGGVALRGYGNKWRQLTVPSGMGDFWSVEYFRKRPYFATLQGIFDFNGRRVQKIDTGLTPSPGSYHLHANDEVLWSFGNDHLCFFDGEKWTYVRHPDNAE